MSGEANKDEDKGASSTGTGAVLSNDGDLSKFSSTAQKESENGISEKKTQSTESTSMQGQYPHYQVGLGQQAHYLYPQQQQTQSSAPNSPSHGPEFDAQAAVFMQQGTSPGNPFRQNPPLPNLPLTAQTQSAPSSTQGGMGALASAAFSNYNPHMEGGTDVSAPYAPSGSPVQSAYTSQGTGMYTYEGVSDWSERNMQQGQHIYPPHIVQPQMAMPHYLHPHVQSGFGNRSSPPFDDMAAPAPGDTQESFSSYTQNQGSMSGSNLAAAGTAPLWGYPHQMPQMDYASHHQMQSMPKSSQPHHHQPHHLPYFLTPGPPIQTMDTNKGPDGANLFIFHIPNHFTNIDMYNLFAPFGQLISVRIMVEKDTGRSRGFGFVSYDNADSAAVAIKELNGMVVANKRLKVQHKQIRATDHQHHSSSQNVSHPQEHPPMPSSNFELNSAGFDNSKVTGGAPIWPTYDAAAKPFPEEAMANITKELETSAPKTDNASTPKKPTEQQKKESRSQDPKPFPPQQLSSNSRTRTNRKGMPDSGGLNRMGTLRNALPDASS